MGASRRRSLGAGIIACLLALGSFIILPSVSSAAESPSASADITFTPECVFGTATTSTANVVVTANQPVDAMSVRIGDKAPQSQTADAPFISHTFTFNDVNPGTYLAEGEVTVDGVSYRFIDTTVAFLARCSGNFDPEPELDSDGDGVNDSVDECPSVPGPASNNGCPVEEVPAPAQPTVTTEVNGNDVVVTVVNTDDGTNAAVSYDVTLNNKGASTGEVADGSSGSVTLTNVPAGTYTGTVTGSDGTTATFTVTVPEAGESSEELVWAGNGSENADPSCKAGQSSFWHWILTPGGNNTLTSATLSVTYESGETTTTKGVFRGNGRGALHFDVTRMGVDVVESASVSFSYDGDGGNFVLTISDSSCKGDAEQPEPPVVTDPVPTVVYNAGSCDVRVPEATVTTTYSSSVGYVVGNDDPVFADGLREVPPGTYKVTLPAVSRGDSVTYRVVVSALDDSAQIYRADNSTFSVPANCGEGTPPPVVVDAADAVLDAGCIIIEGDVFDGIYVNRTLDNRGSTHAATYEYEVLAGGALSLEKLTVPAGQILTDQVVYDVNGGDVFEFRITNEGGSVVYDTAAVDTSTCVSSTTPPKTPDTPKEPKPGPKPEQPAPVAPKPPVNPEGPTARPIAPKQPALPVMPVTDGHDHKSDTVVKGQGGYVKPVGAPAAGGGGNDSNSMLFGLLLSFAACVGALGFVRRREASA